jgi:LysR substrate binding domain
VPKTPDDLAKHDCLEYTYFESRGEWRLLDSNGKEIVVPVSGRYLANNADVLRTTAIAGGGVILCPTFIVGDDLRAGRLVRLLPNYRHRSRGCMRSIHLAGISRRRCEVSWISSSPALAASLHGTAFDAPATRGDYACVLSLRTQGCGCADAPGIPCALLWAKDHQDSGG